MAAVSIQLQKILEYPLPQRCSELTRLIGETSLKDLQTLYPLIIENLFGFSTSGTNIHNGWGLSRITSLNRQKDFESLRHFLGPDGPLLNLAYRLPIFGDGQLKYEFPFSCLPASTRHMLEEGAIPMFYSNKFHYQNPGRLPTSVLLSIIIIFSIKFIKHILVHPSEALYSCLLEDYLHAFLPVGDNVTFPFSFTPTLQHKFPLSQYSGKGFSTSGIPHSHHSSSPPYHHSLLKQSPTLLKITTSPSSSKPNPGTAVDSEHFEIWRSETLVLVLTEFWLNHGSVESYRSCFSPNLVNVEVEDIAELVDYANGELTNEDLIELEVMQYLEEEEDERTEEVKKKFTIIIFSIKFIKHILVHPSEALYSCLLEDYLHAFLPVGDNVTFPFSFTPTLQHKFPLSQYSGKGFSTSGIPHSHHSSSPPYHHSLLKQSPTLLKITTSPSSSKPNPGTAVDSEHFEIWRSETLVLVLTEFWLNHGSVESYRSCFSPNLMTDSVSWSADTTTPVSSLFVEHPIPSHDHMQMVRNFVKYLHYFANSARPINSTSGYAYEQMNGMEILKCTVLQQFVQKRLYTFLRHTFDKWPLDASFRLVNVEVEDIAELVDYANGELTNEVLIELEVMQYLEEEEDERTEEVKKKFTMTDSVSWSADTTTPVSSLFVEHPIPSHDHMQMVRNFVKYLHYFANSARPINSTSGYAYEQMNGMEILKCTVLQQFVQKRLYTFLRHTFDKWPLDASFRLPLETWLSYIQPWRYTNLSGDKHLTKEEEQGQTPKVARWQKFISENLLFYTTIFQQLLPRFLRMELTSPKNAYMLFRVTKVFSQPGLSSMIEEVESTLQEPLSRLTSSQNWPIITEVRTPLRPARDMTVAGTLRQQFLEIEEPGFNFVPLFGDEVRKQINLLLISINQAKDNSAKTLDKNGETKKGLFSYFTQLFSISYDIEGNEDYSQADNKKLEQYLKTSSDQLCAIFKLNTSLIGIFALLDILAAYVDLFQVEWLSQTCTISVLESTLQEPLSRLTSSQNWPIITEVRTPLRPARDMTVAGTLRQQFLEIEEPGFNFVPLFGDEVRKQINLLLISINQAKDNSAKTLDKNGETKKGLFSYFTQLFSISYDIEGNEDYSQADNKKLEQYLKTSSDQLCAIFKIHPQTLSSQHIQSQSKAFEKVSTNLPPDTIIEDEKPKLTDLGRYQILNKLRKVKVSYQGHPDLQPIRSYEITFLVRLLWHISLFLNEKFETEFSEAYYRPGFFGKVSRQILAPPAVYYEMKKTGQYSHQISHHLPPRVNLRWLAHKQTVGYLCAYFLFAFMYGYGSFSAILILIFFITIVIVFKSLFTNIQVVSPSTRETEVENQSSVQENQDESTYILQNK
ncbi:sphingomyelin phosphodiesterase 4-like [Centruroides sculpturatus]|uniref:sphingomyelin phosphodiesterase 4-like n=1 Tax=Centruroides sculpturatus TaxID=218467 RepID=UPI000C6D3DFF|nr:sphingomyelin phosphodiesterase 4-like [Centruroides sculpturatus]